MEECVPVWMVAAVIGPMAAVIGVLWRRIGQQDARTEAMLDDLLARARGRNE